MNFAKYATLICIFEKKVVTLHPQMKCNNMKRTLLLVACACALLINTRAEENHQRFVGGDISTLPLYEQYNSPYKDASGNNIDNLLTWFVKKCGWNTFRVRIFVNPSKKDHSGTSNPSVCQDLEYVTALGKRIKDAGAYFMLDFHYSDTWVDATHFQAPATWKGSSNDVMADSVASYTRRVLNTLKDAGATPDLVQVGNEIMYGLCGIQVHPYEKAGDNWDGYLGLLTAGCNAVREVCPEAQIIIHTDRPTDSRFNSFYYNKLINGGVDFDVIGLSYYPFWHGYLTTEQVKDKTDKNNLVNSINNLATWFPTKRVQIVECAYNFQWWPSSGVNYDTRDAWTCDVNGQYQFVKELVDALKPLANVNGISYWFPEEAGNGDKGTVIPSWQNRGFWKEDKTQSGHAINKTGNVSQSQPADSVCAPYYMKHFLTGAAEGFEQTELKQKGEKRIENGRLVILRNGKRYSVLGVEE